MFGGHFQANHRFSWGQIRDNCKYGNRFGMLSICCRILHTHNGLFWATSVWWSRRRLWRRCSSAASEWAALCHGCRHESVGHHRQHRLVLIAQESSLRLWRLQGKGRTGLHRTKFKRWSPLPPLSTNKQPVLPTFSVSTAAAHNSHRDSLIQRPPTHLVASPLGSGSDQTGTQRAEVGLSDSNVQCATNRTQHTGTALSKQEAVFGREWELAKYFANSNHCRKNMQCTENSARAQLNLGCVWGAPTWLCVWGACLQASN